MEYYSNLPKTCWFDSLTSFYLFSWVFGCDVFILHVDREKEDVLHLWEGDHPRTIHFYKKFSVPRPSPKLLNNFGRSTLFVLYTGSHFLWLRLNQPLGQLGGYEADTEAATESEAGQERAANSEAASKKAKYDHLWLFRFF